MKYEGHGKPDTDLAGSIGDIYTDLDTGYEYELESIRKTNVVKGRNTVIEICYFWNLITEENFGNNNIIDKIIDKSITNVTSNVIKVGASAFTGCTSLVTAKFPLATSIEANAFRDCTKLETLIAPNVANIGSNILYGNRSVTTLDFPKLTRIEALAFQYSWALTKMILRGNTIPTADNTNIFTNTPIASGTGYIYVPSALIESYKTTWSTYASQFRALENYTIDGSVTGVLDESKI